MTNPQLTGVLLFAVMCAYEGSIFLGVIYSIEKKEKKALIAWERQKMEEKKKEEEIKKRQEWESQLPRDRYRLIAIDLKRRKRKWYLIKSNGHCFAAALHNNSSLFEAGITEEDIGTGMAKFSSDAGEVRVFLEHEKITNQILTEEVLYYFHLARFSFVGEYLAEK